MIIVLPVKEEKVTSQVYETYGRAPYHMYYNTDTKEARFIENQFLSGAGGVGVKTSQSALDNGADTVIANRLGENSSAIFERAGVKTFKSIEGGALRNIKKLMDGELESL